MHPNSLAADPGLSSVDLAVGWRVEGEAEMEEPSPGDQIVSPALRPLPFALKLSELFSSKSPELSPETPKRKCPAGLLQGQLP